MNWRRYENDALYVSWVLSVQNLPVARVEEWDQAPSGAHSRYYRRSDTRTPIWTVSVLGGMLDGCPVFISEDEAKAAAVARVHAIADAIKKEGQS